MFDLLQSSNLVIAIVGGTGMFLLQYAGLIWKISKAENQIQDHIQTVEREGEIERAKIRQELVQTKLEFAEKYLHRDSFTQLINNIDARLVRLEGKLDAAISRK